MEKHDIDANSIWLTVKQSSDLLEMSVPMVRRNCQKGRYITRQAEGNGGLRYEILLASLGAQAIEKYTSTILQNGQAETDDEKNGSGISDICRNSCRNGLNKPKYEISSNSVWLTIEECRNFLGLTERAIRKHIASGKYHAIEDNWKGGKRYMVLLDSLPMKARAKYWSQRLKSQSDQPQSPVKDMEIISNLPEYNRRKALKYAGLLQVCEGLAGTDLRGFLNEWNRLHPDLSASYSSVLQARKAHESGGLRALAGNYGKRAGQSSIPNEIFEHFKAAYLVEGGPTAETCYMESFGLACKLGLVQDGCLDGFPTLRAFLYRLRRDQSEDSIYLARNGFAKWNRRFGNFVDRDPDAVQAGEAWFADHRQLDVAVFPDPVPPMARKALRAFLKANSHKRPGFPWITVWRDFRTSKWLGWMLHMEPPNTDHIMQSLYNAMSLYGIPKYLYIDNGKDFRARQFSGGRSHRHKLDVNEKYVMSLVSGLGIGTIFAQPYNAQAKALERDFRIYKDWSDRRMPGFRGGNVVEKPEKLADELADGKILEFADLTAIADYFVSQVLNKAASEGKALKGRSRDQAWDEEFIGLEKVTPDALKLFCMRISEDRIIGRNGIKDHALQHFYWAEWMAGSKGLPVYMRRDPAKYQQSWVFDAKTHEFLGKAHLQARTPAIAKTDLQRQQVQEAIAGKRRAQKIAQEYARVANSDLDVADHLELLARAHNGNNGNGNNGKTLKSDWASLVKITEMDHVFAKGEAQDEADHIDYGSIMPENRPAQRKIVAFTSDIEDDEL